MIIGERAYTKPFQRISKSTRTTPLIRNPSPFWERSSRKSHHPVFHRVKAIRVGEKPLALNKTLLSIDKRTGDGGTMIQTVRAYTSLHKSIYAALVNEFVKAAAAKNIKRVASVAPFGACFDSKTISSSEAGPDVPTVDFELQSKSVYWRFYRWNTMVKAGEGVMCLAFVEAQPNYSGPTTSIVVGGYQMENHLLEFDVSASKLGFSSSFQLRDTSRDKFGAA